MSRYKPKDPRYPGPRAPSPARQRPERLAPLSDPAHETIVCALYELMRDHIPVGVVAGIVKSTETNPPPYTFTNKHLEACAREYVARLLACEARKA
jgi:hypothetical protein